MNQSHHIDHHGGGVVAAASVESGLHERVSGISGIVDAVEDLLDDRVVDHAGDSVAAEQDALGGSQRQQEEIRADALRAAESPGDDVALGMFGRLRSRDLPRVDQLLHDRMVDADLAERVIVEAVDAGVSKVGQQPSGVLLVLDQHGRDAGGAGVPALVRATLRFAVLKDPHLGTGEHLGDVFSPATWVVALLGQPAELLDHDPAGDVAALMTTHPVGHHEDGRRDQEGVLVDLAHMTDLGGSPVMQVNRLHGRASGSSTMSHGVGPASSVEPMSGKEQAPPRTLADQLRRWPDERLAALLRSRPDLATPAPHDSAQLASRAATRSSVFRALDNLTRLELSVLDALVVAHQTNQSELVRIVHADPAATRSAIERLIGLALVWDSPGGLRALSGVSEALRGDESAGVSGLRPMSPDPVPDLESRLAAVSPRARALLEHVLSNGGEGTTGAARRTVSPTDATTPVEELIAHRLLVPRDGGVLVLPGEVGIALRGGHTTTTARDQVPPIATTDREQSLVDRTAGGAAFDAVRRTELLLDHWGLEPPGLLRGGGLGVRDLKAAATELQISVAETGLIIEVASAAGLLTSATDPDGREVWLPTDSFDTWAAGSTAERWVALALAWLDTTRLTSLIGARDPAGKSHNALAPDLSSSMAPDARSLALAQLADVEAGSVLAVGTGVPSLVERVGWLRPRRPALHRDLVAAAVHEAGLLGLVGAGGLSAAGRAVIEHDHDAALVAIAPHLPHPVDHVLLQADLTAVAPGPLETELARTLHLLADVESRGGATVYRFTNGSVRRAFDAGWSAMEVHDFIGSVSRTPIPQPLTYLVDDVARTFGTVRVGQAEAFLRADDEAALTELLHNPRASTLGLRRIAPTVLISTVPVDVLLPRLRELGAAPVVEAPDGTVRIARRDLLRARRPRTSRNHGAVQARAEAGVASVVTAIRSGDQAGASRPAGPALASTPSGALSALREAIEGRETVVIGYVDNHGASSDRVIDPVRLEGGQLSAYDHRSDDERLFAVHRITTVTPLAPHRT